MGEDMDEDISKFRSPDGSTDSDVEDSEENEQDEPGKPHGKGSNQGQLERLLRPGVEDKIMYKKIACLEGSCTVQYEDGSVELSLEQAMSFTIDQMTHRVCKIEHLIERAQRQLEASE